MCLIIPVINVFFFYGFRCNSMYVGEYCQHLNPCITGTGGPRCQNGGSCDVVITNTSSPKFICRCPIGFTASLCEINQSSACDSNPCRNGGTCMLTTLKEFTCACALGFTGNVTYIIKTVNRSNDIFCRTKIRSFWIYFTVYMCHSR